MVYTSKIKLPLKEQDKKYYFLAGSIDYHLAGNWREKVISEMESQVHFFDPTRIEYNEFNNFQMKEHIKWELNALDLSDKILLNFLPNAKSPISLVELGLYVKTSKLIVVCPNQFYQKRYVYTICEKYNTPCFNDLDKAIKYLRKDN